MIDQEKLDQLHTNIKAVRGTKKRKGVLIGDNMYISRKEKIYFMIKNDYIDAYFYAINQKEDKLNYLGKEINVQLDKFIEIINFRYENNITTFI